MIRFTLTVCTESGGALELRFAVMSASTPPMIWKRREVLLKHWIVLLCLKKASIIFIRFWLSSRRLSRPSVKALFGKPTSCMAVILSILPQNVKNQLGVGHESSRAG